MTSLENTITKTTSSSSSSELASFIKETHKSLRTVLKESKDDCAESLWIKHTQNKNQLKKYAQAMYTLATEHWENKGNLSRIRWIHDSVIDYFFKGGLEQRTEKEGRKVSFIRENELCTFENIRNTLETYENSRPLKVLDVGSCYNPFGHFEDMDVTPIDLCPAKPDVFSCDFLSLKVVKVKKMDGNGEVGRDVLTDAKKRPFLTDAEILQNCKRFKALTDCSPGVGYDIEELEGGSFDVVIFCLFLEYIPCPKLRFTCCEKAYNLLKPNGVLCIVTPDSKHEGANIHLFKMWKITLSNLGFNRINYHKSLHFHGMLFRKGLIPSVWQDDSVRELKEIESKTLATKFTGINYEFILKSIYIVQEIEELKSNASS